jgi:hypothetical protein
MTWTAGQREFTPLLLGLYHLLPPRKFKKRPEVDWVVIEEPEMGLHPDAVSVCMLLVLDLLWRGYRVVISTHSPLVLDIVWAVQRLAATGARWQLLADAFRVPLTPAIATVMKHALQSDYRVYYLHQEPEAGKRVVAKDISSLDPSAPDEHEAFWGGLTDFSSSFGEVVRMAANEKDFA